MAPVMTMRHYSRYVVSYLSSLVKLHQKTIDSTSGGQGGRRLLYSSQFLTFFDAIFTVGPGSLPKDVQAELAEQYPAVKV